MLSGNRSRAEEINREALEQFIHILETAWNSHEMERVAPLYTADYTGVDVSQNGAQEGDEGIRAMMTRYWRAFPDLNVTFDEMLIDGPRVALTYTARGTHHGPILNIPPTGRPVQVRGMASVEIAGDQIQRAFFVWDVAGLLRSIGLLPDL